MLPSSTDARLSRFIAFTLFALLMAACASMQDTPIQAYTWELGRKCDTSTMTMSRVDRDGRYWVRPAPNIISVAPYFECMREQARLRPFKNPELTSQTTKKDDVVAASPDTESQRLFEQVRRLYQEGQYDRAVPLAERALAIREALGFEDQTLANALTFRAMLYKSLGDDKRAEALYQRALVILEKALGPEHLGLATALNNLAELYKYQDPQKAERLFQRSLAIREKAFGPDHPTVAIALNHLGWLYADQGAYGRAEPLFERALAIWEKAPESEQRYTATGFYNLAELYTYRGEYGRAEPLFLRAVALYEKTLGPDHPSVARALAGESRFYWRKGDLAQAIALRMRSDDIRERNIDRVLLVGSETQKRLYLASLDNETQINISLHVDGAPVDKAALRLALTTVLRRKGRILDAMVQGVRATRDSDRTENQELFRRWTALRSQLATLVLQGPGAAGQQVHRGQLGKVSAQIEEVEKQLGVRPEESAAGAPLVTIERVQSAIPADAALIEFVRYWRFDPRASRAKAWYGTGYAAYILRPTGDVTWTDLGAASVIDQTVQQFLEALNDPGRSDVAEVARDLDHRVMKPVRVLLAGERFLLVSPDAALNLVPFGALLDDNGHYLGETYTFSYLTSGRDLLRESRAAPRTGPVILADPDFDDATGERDGPVTVEARRSIDFSSPTFGRLRGTAAEAAALSKLFPDATVLTRGNATEAAVKEVRGPRILHIATHGFFLPDQVVSTADWSMSDDEMDSQRLLRESPLLRAGLALAGANRLRSGREDGILTALEVAGLDLVGTKLVVLSACQTGVGVVQAGDGVFGLRRALVLAGAESQVVSLWKVADDATLDLMVMYYRLLLNGMGRAQALQRAQQEMAQREGRRHPFFWASFIPVGEWRALSEDIRSR